MALVDDLLPTIDALRLIAEGFGVRQHVVKLVKRTWTGVERGDGDFSDVEVVVSPAPRVEFAPPPGWRFDLKPQGREEEGLIKLTEVSLNALTEANLLGGTLGKVEQFFWLLTDPHAQGIKSRAYLPASPPVTDREKTLGWVVYLRRAEGVEPGPTW